MKKITHDLTDDRGEARTEMGQPAFLRSPQGSICFSIR